jgi:L-threonylcarbamoyladenylate synthase
VVDLPLLPGVDDAGVVEGVADRAARVWLAGGLVGLPTETVYGLSADAQDPVAVARIYAAKGRPADHPLIVHVQGPQALAGWSAGPNAAAERLAAAFWPGALTVVVARSERAGDFITGGQDTVALRCPDHPVARACLEALARLSGDPARGVAAPSANRFGRVSPTRALDVLAEVGPSMDPARDLVVDGGPCAIGVESTIVDRTAHPPRVLRLGAISQEQIDAVLAGDVEGSVPAAVLAGAEISEVRTPGTLESHYAPVAAVLLVEAGGFESFASGRESWPRTGLVAASEVVTPDGWTRLAAPVTAEEYARELYVALRRADELELAIVVAVLPDATGGPLALAVRDRLARAAYADGS